MRKLHRKISQLFLLCIFNEPLPPTRCLEVGDFLVNMLNTLDRKDSSGKNEPRLNLPPMAEKRSSIHDEICRKLNLNLYNYVLKYKKNARFYFI